MALQLPRLTTVVDCGPIGYPGLEVEFWLNPPFHEDEATGADDSWDTTWYRTMARVFERVRIPGEYTENGEPETIEVPDAQALWELERMDDFDPQIIVWSFTRFGQERQARLQEERKNS